MGRGGGRGVVECAEHANSRAGMDSAPGTSECCAEHEWKKELKGLDSLMQFYWLFKTQVFQLVRSRVEGSTSWNLSVLAFISTFYVLFHLWPWAHCNRRLLFFIHSSSSSHMTHIFVHNVEVEGGG